MKKIFASVAAFLLACSVFAGGTGILVKGASKSWDEIARIALRASGKSMTDDAVKGAAKTIEKAMLEYGDDVAKASMRGGVEIAEQSLKRGGRFVSILKGAGSYSDDALRAIALNADDILKLSGQYGDDVVKWIGKTEAPDALIHGLVRFEKTGIPLSGKTLETLATKIPPDDINRVVGAIERNPKVGQQFLDGVTKGGKTFVDRIFEINAKQILAGTLGAAAITAAIRLTAPQAAEGEATRKTTETMIGIATNGASTPEQTSIVKDWMQTNRWVRYINASGPVTIGWVLAVFAGIALLVFAVRKSRSTGRAPKNVPNKAETDVQHGDRFR